MVIWNLIQLSFCLFVKKLHFQATGRLEVKKPVGKRRADRFLPVRRPKHMYSIVAWSRAEYWPLWSLKRSNFCKVLVSTVQSVQKVGTPLNCQKSLISKNNSIVTIQPRLASFLYGMWRRKFFHTWEMISEPRLHVSSSNEREESVLRSFLSKSRKWSAFPISLFTNLGFFSFSMQQRGFSGVYSDPTAIFHKLKITVT